jgi:hypothetical protein
MGRARPLDAAQARARPAADGLAAAATADQDHLAAAGQRAAEVEMIGRGNLDPLYNKWYSQQVLRQAGIFVALWFLVVPVSGLLFTLAGAAAGDATGALSIWVRIGILFSLALAALFWLVPVPALLSQRSKLIANEGDAAALVFRHVAEAFARHQTPLDLLQEKSLAIAGEGRRDYLELRRSHFSGYISCFAHGRDLYVGWTFWLRLSPLRWMLMRIARRFHELTGRGSDIYQTLRYEPARATVAALHSAVQEGTATAAAELGGSQPPAGPTDVTRLDID